MSAVWVVRDGHGEMIVAMATEARAVAFAKGIDSWTITQGSLITPAHAAVIAAADDLKPLARLGAWALEHIRSDSAGDIDAFELQDEAERLGVIAPVSAPKPCGSCCVCEEMDADTCYIDTEATKNARAALREQEGA